MISNILAKKLSNDDTELKVFSEGRGKGCDMWFKIYNNSFQND